MDLPDDLLQRPAAEAARRIAWAFLDDARRASHGLARGEATALHDFRVALRRLRSLAKSHERHLGDALDAKRRRQLGRLQRATGSARDLEVQLRWVRRLRKPLSEPERRALRPLVTSLEAAVERARRRAPADVHARFAALEGKLRARLETYPASWRRPSAAYGPVVGGLTRGHTSALVSLLEPIDSLDAVAALHEARIAGKRLRYLLEPVAPHAPGADALVTQLKKLQDLLGDIHDMHVLGETLSDARKRTKRKRRPALDALAERARSYAERCFEELGRQFAGRALEALVTDAEAVASALEAAAVAGLEIERKYLLSSLPDEVRRHEATEIAQGYLPGERLHERLRRSTRGAETTYLRTVKAGRGVARIEIEEETSEAIFETMWPLTEGRRVLKRRYAIDDGGLRWEIDEFLDRDLVLAEVELPRVDATPELPSWLLPHVVRDVTGEDAYVNLNLAK